MSGTELAIVLVAVVIGAIAKAVTGMGLPLIAIPIASLFVDVNDAIVVIAFPNVLANAFLAGRERSSYPETRDLPTLAIAGVVGLAVYISGITTLAAVLIALPVFAFFFAPIVVQGPSDGGVGPT